MTITRKVPPVVRAVVVPWGVAAAFRRFTAEIGTWWPLRTHSLGQERARAVVFEEWVGGRIYEEDDGGETNTWGTVVAWEPPSLVGFTWHPGQDASSAQDVRVRFVAEGSGTRVEVTHSGWERLGERAAAARRSYNLGWPPVLDLYAGRYTARVALVNAVAAAVRAWRRVAGGKRA